MRVLALLLLMVVAAAAGTNAAAQETEGLRLAPAPVNRLDDESLQRGARNFVNYCLNCHSARYMRYNRLTDLGLTEDQIANNLMFASDKVGETMTVPITAAEGKAWFGN
ncbi:MAG: cytochrome c1, partial [Betaproteobacteria bacterium]